MDPDSFNPKYLHKYPYINNTYHGLVVFIQTVFK